MKVDAEPLGDDPLEVDPTPAHDAVDLTIRTRHDNLRELSQLLLRQAGLGAVGPGVDEPVRTRGVETMDPVAQRLVIRAAGFTSIRPETCGRAVLNASRASTVFASGLTSRYGRLAPVAPA
jgi:hypothetical protein